MCDIFELNAKFRGMSVSWDSSQDVLSGLDEILISEVTEQLPHPLKDVSSSISFGRVVVNINVAKWRRSPPPTVQFKEDPIQLVQLSIKITQYFSYQRWSSSFEGPRVSTSPREGGPVIISFPWKCWVSVYFQHRQLVSKFILKRSDPFKGSILPEKKKKKKELFSPQPQLPIPRCSW